MGLAQESKAASVPQASEFASRSTLSEPFQLLYVLHMTRTGAPQGRYEIPELGADDVRRFLEQFGRFLPEDSRHDIGVRAHGDDATIVLDRHNLILACGRLDVFESELVAAGWRARRFGRSQIHTCTIATWSGTTLSVRS